MQTLRGAWPANWKALLLCALLPLPLRAQDPATVRERAKAVLAEQNCQDRLPAEQHDGGGEAAAPGGSSAGGGPLAPGERAWRRSGDLDFGSFGGSFARLLLWTVVGVAVAGIVAMVLRSFGERAAGRTAAARVRAGPDGAAAPGDALPDHAAFAAAGDFAAAIHALLQHALRSLQQRLGGLRPSTTGREALAAARMLPDGVPALRTLVLAVERTRFGGQPAARSDYDASKDALARWSTACAQPK